MYITLRGTPGGKSDQKAVESPRGPGKHPAQGRNRRLSVSAPSAC